MSISILNITEDMSAKSGGIAAIVDLQSNYLFSEDYRPSVLTVRADPIQSNTNVEVIIQVPHGLTSGWGFSKNLFRVYRQFKEQSRGIFHIHGIWSAPQLTAAFFALRKKIPFVVSVHGQLEPWFWKGQNRAKYFKKYLYWHLLAKHLFKNATCIHAITDQEAATLKKYFPKARRIITLPNSIEIPTGRTQAQLAELNRYLLFVGRLCPQKGIDTLLHAFRLSGVGDQFSLKIIGPLDSDQEYAAHLKDLANELGLGERVRFLDAKFGAEKTQLIENAWACIFPSRVEVIGMVNLESAALYTPSVTTHQTGLSSWERGGGLLLDCDSPSQLAETIRAVANWTIEERMLRGQSSRELVEKSFNIKIVTNTWKQVYTQILLNDCTGT